MPVKMRKVDGHLTQRVLRAINYSCAYVLRVEADTIAHSARHQAYAIWLHALVELEGDTAELGEEQQRALLEAVLTNVDAAHVLRGHALPYTQGEMWAACAPALGSGGPAAHKPDSL
jgi:hypothetical protein